MTTPYVGKTDPVILVAEARAKLAVSYQAVVELGTFLNGKVPFDNPAWADFAYAGHCLYEVKEAAQSVEHFAQGVGHDRKAHGKGRSDAYWLDYWTTRLDARIATLSHAIATARGHAAGG